MPRIIPNPPGRYCAYDPHGTCNSSEFGSFTVALGHLELLRQQGCTMAQIEREDGKVVVCLGCGRVEGEHPHHNCQVMSFSYPSSDLLAWLASLPKQDRYRACQVHSKGSMPGCSAHDLYDAATALATRQP